MIRRLLKYKWIGLTLLVALISCKADTCFDLGTCPEESVVERTDILIEGDIELSSNQQSAQNDKSEDLVFYNFYGIPSNKIDFNVTMSNGNVLRIRVFNNHNINPWEFEDIDYATYPTQDLEDKWKYIVADYVTGAETPSYSTNLGVNFPPGVTLDVFRITYYDGIEIKCRIRDMLMYKNTNPSKTIEINGTFTGAVTFLE